METGMVFGRRKSTAGKMANYSLTEPVQKQI